METIVAIATESQSHSPCTWAAGRGRYTARWDRAARSRGPCCPCAIRAERCRRPRSTGTAVVISHDRYFLDRICTHILAFEGDSQVYWFEGTYSEYEENRKKRLGNVGPQRVKYRKLVRD